MSTHEVDQETVRLIVDWLHEKACRCYRNDRDYAGDQWVAVADSLERKFTGKTRRWVR